MLKTCGPDTGGQAYLCGETLLPWAVPLAWCQALGWWCLWAVSLLNTYVLGVWMADFRALQLCSTAFIGTLYHVGAFI